MSFKRITLSFVYFCQVTFFWAVMVHINESNIGNFSQTLSKSREYSNSFVRTLELQILYWVFFKWTFNSVFIFYWCTLSYKLGDSMKLGLQTMRKNKITKEAYLQPSQAHLLVVNYCCKNDIRLGSKYVSGNWKGNN